jgi:lipid-binding SYLF domain-containing protein
MLDVSQQFQSMASPAWTRRLSMKLHILALHGAFISVQALALAVPAGVALAAQSQPAQQGSSSAGSSGSAATAADKHVDDSTAVVQRMAGEPGMDRLLAKAKGIYVIPNYGRAALGLGASGGAGVFLAKRPDGTWSDPAFFNTGGVSIGLQAGVEGGPVALILVNDKAVNGFREKNNFNISADAGLTVVDWSKLARGNVGNGDVVAWSASKGLFGNVAAIAINDVRFNAKATQAYYGKPTTVHDVMNGKVSNPHGDPLKQALAGSAAPKQ